MAEMGPTWTAEALQLDLGADRALALAYAPRERRLALTSLWRLDRRMRRIFLERHDTAVAEIKLAWWQERLERISFESAPAEPLLRTLAAEPMLRGQPLAALAEAWRELGATLPFVPSDLDAYASKRGRSLISIGAHLLGSSVGETFLLAGESAALSDLARLHVERDERIDAAARARFAQAGPLRWPCAMRPIGMLVELARHDAVDGRVGREGSPARVARMAWLAITGR